MGLIGDLSNAISNAITGGNIDEVIKLTTPHPESGITEADITEAVNNERTLRELASCTNPQITDINFKFSEDDSYILSPLGLAVVRENLIAVQKFLEKEADPNSIGCLGNLVLADAIKAGNLEIVKTLLERGASTNVGASIGSKFLYRDLTGKIKEIVKRHMYPYDYALELGKQDIAELIKTHAIKQGIEYSRPLSQKAKEEIQDVFDRVKLPYEKQKIEKIYEELKFLNEEVDDFVKQCMLEYLEKRYQGLYGGRSAFLPPSSQTGSIRPSFQAALAMPDNISHVTPEQPAAAIDKPMAAILERDPAPFQNQLERAVFLRQYDTVLEILRARPDYIYQKDDNGNNILHQAAVGGDMDTFLLLFKNLEPEKQVEMYNAKNVEGKDLFALAKLSGNTELAREINYGIYNLRGKVQDSSIPHIKSEREAQNLASDLSEARAGGGAAQSWSPRKETKPKPPSGHER